mmetsp:Transcript_102008/g.285977  ORF Transcript_102008/g.285977 Transcript_102008/m.285977 type:complete len:224 (-) Transcript_102008:153-824(-)
MRAQRVREDEVEGAIEGDIVTGLLCTATEVKQTKFEFVGGGRGDYDRVLSYRFAGQGSGAFQKEQPQFCTTKRVCAFLCLASLLLVIGYCFYVGTGFGSANDSDVQSSSAASCGVDSCVADYVIGRNWSNCTREWCCLRQGLGCSDGGDLRPTLKVGTLKGELRGCASACFLKNETWSCTQRISYVTKHDNMSCVAAQLAVAKECSFCSSLVCAVGDKECNKA